MSDSKVSGLPGAASLLSTHEFPVNEGGASKKVTGAQIQATVANGVGGRYVPVTANQGSITAQVDLTNLTLTFTPIAGRRFKLVGYTFPSSTVADDQVVLYIMEGATQLQLCAGFARVANQGFTLQAVAYIQPTAAAHTYKLQMARGNGTGTITMNASGTNPAWLAIEDAGV